MLASATDSQLKELERRVHRLEMELLEERTRRAKEELELSRRTARRWHWISYAMIAVSWVTVGLLLGVLFTR